MVNRIRKGCDLYQEALIWMGYRYAIGLTEGIRMQADQGIEQYKLFREIEYDTPEFHALASEISEYLKRKKIKDVIDLRNRLSWNIQSTMAYIRKRPDISIHIPDGSRQ